MIWSGMFFALVGLLWYIDSGQPSISNWVFWGSAAVFSIGAVLLMVGFDRRYGK